MIDDNIETGEHFINPDVDHWERISHMRGNDGNEIKNPEVIYNGMGAEDISQGDVGDCWFLSAMSVVAYNRPDLIEKLLHEDSRKFREDGLYILRFYKMGYQRLIIVDDRFPVNRDRESVF